MAVSVAVLLLMLSKLVIVQWRSTLSSQGRARFLHILQGQLNKQRMYYENLCYENQGQTMHKLNFCVKV